MDAARPHIPADTRPMIEGRESTGGLVRRSLDMKLFKEIGLPEAVYLHLQGCGRVFTIETPSEYGLDRRVRAHVAVIEECLKRLEACQGKRLLMRNSKFEARNSNLIPGPLSGTR
jgi:hypothetical protein